MEFKNRIVIIGYGIVAQALLPLLVKHVRVPLSRVVVIDFADRAGALAPWIAKGLQFVRERITPLSLARLLSAHARRGDLIIDLAWSVDFFEIVEWAHEHEVLYVNASLESWDPAEETHRKSTLEKSLYARYTKLLPLRQRWGRSTTALVDQGANPGLVSSLVKQGLLDLGAAILAQHKGTSATARKLQRLIETEDFPALARALEVKVIHCSEWDTQRANLAKAPDEFVSTWSVEAMWEESISPCELGWGTHERWLPPAAIRPQTGPCNQIVLPQMGLNAWVRSWVPHQEIVGMLVTHGESFGLSHALTVREHGKVVYRPTVHYAYMPCGDSIVALHELRARNYELHPRKRILADEIVAGTDVVGALLMGHRLRSWWIGSILSIDEARKKVPGVNATAVQVASGVLAGTLWALRNPARGLCLPEDLPHREILEAARPYLGEITSVPSDWTPLSHHREYFEEESDEAIDRSDPWQFKNFVFRG
ncbi:MAG TPA: saccharopine dehydrogenase C-terminal domain-containing protein [Opitutaceae bacterium]|jgi:homospermidine synthase|nr:saccharopine dehydrogenase C-terminal domain-containing protein [Opitutaceae bacterium]HOR24904.1 saccharopine dehydrogenase C-terminal domain-containing protein [Opitutaceae bacterium]HPK49244.1 saccharopine dehydrogenase C-terminal domain-containing protein [Opitutaceae bacterium]